MRPHSASSTTVSEESLRARTAALSPRKRELLALLLAEQARHAHTDSEQLVAYVVGQASIDRIRDELTARLPSYMVPGAIVSVESVPRTPNGKLDVSTLPEPEHGRSGGVSVVSSRDIVEYRVARIWERVLGVPSIGVTESFFALGGHSLLALRMLADIEADLGRRIAVKTLFENPTIEHLAAAIRRERVEAASSPAICIQPAGKAKPLFIVHPAGGNVFRYWGLSKALGTERPLWGMRSVGLEGEATPLSSVEAMASVYIAAMRDIQSRGPYRIAGWSMGGMIAYEMARQLVRDGERVALLAILDTVAPGPSDPSQSPEDLTHAPPAALIGALGENFVMGLTPEETWQLTTLQESEQLDAILRLARSRHALASTASAKDLRALLEVFRNNHIAVETYMPAPDYAGRIALLRGDESDEDDPAASNDRTLGWENFARGGVDVRDVPGNHRTMLQEPKVAVLAATLRDCLKLADQLEAESTD